MELTNLNKLVNCSMVNKFDLINYMEIANCRMIN